MPITSHDLFCFAASAGEQRDEGEVSKCLGCCTNFGDDDLAYYVESDSGHYCESCVEKIVEVVGKEAEAYAHENCKVLRPPDVFDPEYEFKCSPES